MAVPIADYFNRITDRQKALIANSQAFSFGTGTSHVFPHTRNILNRVAVVSQDNRTWTYRVTVSSSLMVGNMTAGLEGEIETNGQGWVFDVLTDFINMGHGGVFNSANYPIAVAGFVPGSLTCEFNGMQAVTLDSSSAALAFVFQLTWNHIEVKG